MRRFSILFCAAAIAAVACNKVEQEQPLVEESNLRPMTFTATTTDTRTSLDANGKSINWSSEDYISVFDGQGNQSFQASGSGRTVEFNGNADPDASVYYALYPYNENASLSGTTVTTSLPANQNPVEGTFDSGLNISAAKTAGETTFHFSNVMSIAKFTIDSDALGGKSIKTVKFSSTYPLAGDVLISYGETFTASAGTNTVNEITMTKDGGFANGTYYFAVLPNDGGAITMTFESTDGCTASISATLGKAFSAGVIKNLGTVGGLVWETPQTETSYKLVTSSDGLPAIGDIIIVSGNNAMAEDRGNNRGAATVPDAVNSIITLDNTSAAHVFKLEHTSSGYLIKDGESFLYAPNTSSNHLKTRSDVTVECYWSFSFDDGVLDLVNCNNTNKHLRFNSTNNPPIFSCYGNGQSSISIYLNEDSVIEELNTPEILAAANGSSIEVTWTDVANATSYLVTCTGEENQTIGTGVQYAIFENLADGLYEVSVIAKTSASGYIDSTPAIASNIRVGTPTLENPTDVSVVQTGSGFSASWTASSNATSYDWVLYDNEGLTSVVTNGNVSSTTLSFDISLTEGTTYYFTVQAKAEGYTSSPVSSAFSFIAQAFKNKVFLASDYYAIDPALTLTKSPITGTFAKGDGTSAPAVTESRVRLYQPSSGHTKGGTLTITSTASNILMVEFTFENGQNYLTSSIGAYNSTGDNSATWSTPTAVNSVEFYCNGQGSNYRADIASFTVYYDSNAPEQLFMGAISCTDNGENENSLTFHWDSVTGADGYQISEDGNTYSSTQSDNNYTLSGLQPGTTHTIWVKAIGDGTNYLTSEAKESESGTTKNSGGNTVTYTFSSKSWAASPANWTSGKDGNQMSNGRGIQITSSTSGANATSPVSFTNVSKVVITYSTNASSGAGSIAVQVGNGTAKSQNVTKTGGMTDRTLTYSFSPNETGNVKLTVNCTDNSIYVKSIAITTP